MIGNFADRLLEAIERAGSPVCVGIDPVCERLPSDFDKVPDPVRAIEQFSRVVIEIVAGIVPAVKVQIAYFERYGSEGVAAYERIVADALSAGLIVIGDVKRGDIGSTVRAYAAGHLERENSPDAITVNGYFGADGLAPFIESVRRTGKGIFIIVRTSNPSAVEVQDFTDSQGKRFYEHLAEQVASIGNGEGLIGEKGYSCIGAVVGATYPAEVQQLRRVMPRQIFLLPGYGAQGASARDCLGGFRSDKTGAIVSASRSVIYAYQQERFATLHWKDAIAQAARDLADDIRQTLDSEM